MTISIIKLFLTDWISSNIPPKARIWLNKPIDNIADDKCSRRDKAISGLAIAVLTPLTLGYYAYHTYNRINKIHKLHEAATAINDRYAEVSKILCKNPTLVDHSKFDEAIKSRNLALVDEMLVNKPELIYYVRTADGDVTPLSDAIRQGDKELVKVFVKHKGHLENGDRVPPLVTALHCGLPHYEPSVSIIKLLISNGAAVDGPTVNYCLENPHALTMLEASGHKEDLIKFITDNYGKETLNRLKV